MLARRRAVVQKFSRQRSKRMRKASPSLEAMGVEELRQLRRIQSQVKRQMALHPDGPKTVLERLALRSAQQELTELAHRFASYRDQVEAQMKQTKLRSMAVSAYSKAYRKG